MTSFTRDPTSSFHSEINPTRFRLPFRNTVTNFDRHLIKQSLADAEKRSKKNQMELNRLKAAIVVVKSKQATVEKEIEHYRSLLSPIQRMPPEIMTEIFGHCCQKAGLSGFSMPMAMAISMVCGRWRELAVSTPSLWSSIRFSILRDQPRVTRLMKLFLQRSSTHSLDFELTWSTKEGVAYFLANLQPHSHRLRKIVFGISVNTLAHPAFQLFCTSSFPILTHLTLSIADRAGSPIIDVGTIDFFPNVPALLSFNLQKDSGVEVLPNLPWRALGILTLHGNITGLRSMLSSCINLSRLKLSGVVGIEAELGGRVVSNVQQLAITECDRNNVVKMFELFAFPRLNSLELDHIPLFDPQCLAYLKDFIIPSTNTITFLQLNRLNITDDNVISLLYLLPEVRYLSIEELSQWSEEEEEYSTRNVTITSAFLRRLSCYHHDRCISGAKPFLPKLTNLRLVVHKNGFDSVLLVNAIASRWRGSKGDISNGTVMEGFLGLERVAVGIIPLDENEDVLLSLSALECLRDAGLSVNLGVLTPGTPHEYFW